MPSIRYTTGNELEFLHDLAVEGKANVLAGYIRVAETYARDWVDIDPRTVLFYARLVLREARERRPITPWQKFAQQEATCAG